MDHLIKIAEKMDIQDFRVCVVSKIDGDKWNVHLGLEENDPWITVTKEQIGREPEVGDVIMIVLPMAIGIEKSHI